MKSILFSFGLVCVTSCAPYDPYGIIAVKEMASRSIAQSERMEQDRRVNVNWSVGITEDAVTGNRRSFAGTFGQPMAHDGRPYGTKSIPFQIYFDNDSGPFVLAGLNTYPGRNPTVRVDQNSPILVNNDAGVTAKRPDTELVRVLRHGKIARVRYHVWPNGSEDIYVDLTGVEEAWQKLQTKRGRL